MNGEYLLQLIVAYRYAIIAPAALLFGPIVTLVCGVLIHAEVLDLWPTVAALAAGELGGDVLWYWLGHRYGEGFVGRYGRFFGISSERISAVKKLYRRYQDGIVLASKLSAGFGIASVVFFTAGLSRVPFERYIVFNVLGQILGTTALIAFGYFLGDLFLQTESVFGRIAYAGMLVLLGAAFIGFVHYLRSRVGVE